MLDELEYWKDRSLRLIQNMFTGEMGLYEP